MWSKEVEKRVVTEVSSTGVTPGFRNSFFVQKGSPSLVLNSDLGGFKLSVANCCGTALLRRQRACGDSGDDGAADTGNQNRIPVRRLYHICLGRHTHP